jgi:hypothetical protein
MNTANFTKKFYLNIKSFAFLCQLQVQDPILCLQVNSCAQKRVKAAIRWYQHLWDGPGRTDSSSITCASKKRLRYVQEFVKISNQGKT